MTSSRQQVAAAAEEWLAIVEALSVEAQMLVTEDTAASVGERLAWANTEFIDTLARIVVDATVELFTLTHERLNAGVDEQVFRREALRATGPLYATIARRMAADVVELT